MNSNDNYWKRVSRRRVLKGAGATAIVGGLAMAGVACGDDDDDGGSSNGNGDGTGTATSTSGANGGNGSPVMGGRLQEINTAEPDQYDPHRDAGYPGLMVMSAVYNGLLRTRLPIGEDFVVEGDLATALPEQPDETTYVFKLPAGAKWQNVEPTNGRAITSDDIKQNFERMVTNQPDYVLRPIFEIIDSIETPDDTTVQVKLKSPYGQFIVNVADVWAKVIPPELYDGDQAKVRPVGSGPFIFREAQQGVGQTLDKNPDYFRSGQPYIDGIDFVLVTDHSVRASSFKAGNLDTLHSAQAQIFTELIDDYKDANYDKRFGVMNPLMINNSVAPFNDVRVRQALYHAMDPVLVTQLGYQGLAEPGQPIPVWLTRYNLAENEIPAHDVQKAKELLAAAGHENLSFVNKTFQGAANSFGNLQVQQSFKEAGINMEIQEMEWADWRLNVYGVKGDFEITVGGEFDYISPDRQLYNAFHSAGSANNRHVNDPELDKLLVAAREELDPDNQVEKYRELAKYLVDNAISVWLPQGLGYVGTQKWVKNWFWQYSSGALFERNYMDEVYIERA